MGFCFRTPFLLGGDVVKELEISLKVEGGNITWNYEEVKKQVLESRLEHVECKTGQAAYYLGMRRSEFRANLLQLEAVKERYTNEYLQSIQAFHDQVDYVMDILKEQEKKVDDCLANFHAQSRKEKEERVISYVFSKMQGYGVIMHKILQSDWFWEEEWLAKKMSNRKLYQSLDEKISSIVCQLESIKKYQTPLLLRYVECHDMKQVYAYYHELKELDESMEISDVSAQTLVEAEMDFPKGNMEYKITGNWQQIKQLEEYARFIDATAVRTQNNMPKGLCPHKEMDFSSFVAVDLENSGSYGLVNGDTPSEIIEIGAVRYENGQCVDRFSMLVDPKRPIVPAVQNLTGITDEMVKNQPSPEEAVAAFAAFAKDAIWVGHDLKNADIPFLERVARKCGIHFENEYFDTYEYAKLIKEEEQFEKLKLGELAAYYGLYAENLHRACDDAELTAKLYLAMKEKKEKKLA